MPKSIVLWKKSKKAVGTSSGVTLTIDHTSSTDSVASTSKPTNTALAFSPRHVSVAGDLAANVTIESPANTVLWQKDYSAAFADEIRFAEGELLGAASSDLVVKISASTAACSAAVAYDIVPANEGISLAAPGF